MIIFKICQQTDFYFFTGHNIYIIHVSPMKLQGTNEGFFHNNRTHFNFVLELFGVLHKFSVVLVEDFDLDFELVTVGLVLLLPTVRLVPNLRLQFSYRVLEIIDRCLVLGPSEQNWF